MSEEVWLILNPMDDIIHATSTFFVERMRLCTFIVGLILQETSG